MNCREPASSPTAIGYGFYVAPDSQYFSILQDFTDVSPIVMARGNSPAIRQGQATNSVTLSCIGTTISGSVNGTVVASIPDDTYTDGGAWLYVGTMETGGIAEARFDNLVVTQP